MKRQYIHLCLLILAGCVAAKASDADSAGADQTAAAAAPAAVVTNGLAATAEDGAPPAAAGDPAADDPEEMARQVELRRAIAAAAESPAEVAVPATGLEAFRIIFERNIFNPNRSPRGRPEFTQRETRRPVRRERFGLVGTMSYEKGRFAFFDGSSSEFRKVAEPAEMIAGYRIAEIGANSVTLESTNGKLVQLVVGMQMRREDDAEWQPGGGDIRGERPVETDLSTNASDTANNAPALAGSDSSGDDESEVLKRLLQKREEEFNDEK